MLSGKTRRRRWPRFALEDVHRFLGLLTGAFVVVHGGTLLLDGVPAVFARPAPRSRNRAVPAAGSLLRGRRGRAPRRPGGHEPLSRKLSYRFWRRAHYLNFAVWLFALVHGLTAGTDAFTTWALMLYAGSAWLVLALTVHRATAHLGGQAARN
jgi:hypothetical protein